MKDQENPPLKLPKLREGISFKFSDYDVDGKPQWLIHDAGRNKFFIIGWVEYELLSRWNIGDPKALLQAVNDETTLQVDFPDLEHLLKFLANNYLIQQSGTQIYQRAKEQKLFKKDNLLHWLISYYLFFRIPLFHPDKFLNRTKRIGEIVFSRYAAYIMISLAVIALYQLSTKWDLFVHTFPSVISLKGLFFYLIAYLICKFCHELGHAYMCKQYNVPVPTLGLAFLVFWPVLYTDTTLSWSLNNKQRFRIALAGMWVETYLTIIAALIWCNTDNITLQSICYVTIAINWMASLLINVSPFMRFDGYYALADFVKMPNLQPRAFALTRWQIRRWLFNWDDPPPEKFNPHMHHFLVIYSIITWVYRLSLYFGIALLVYHFFVKILGIILFIIEIFYFILGPVYYEVQTWLILKDRFKFNVHTITTLTVGLFLILFLFLPIKNTVEMPATLRYLHQFLVAPQEGILKTKLPALGTYVKANQPIIELTSPLLTESLQSIKLEYTKKLSQLRRATINPKFAYEKNILDSDISKQRAEYQKLLELSKQLTLSVPFDGIVKEVVPEISPGTTVMKNEWLGDVVAPHILQVEAYASQIDFDRLKKNLHGYFYPHDIGQPTLPVTVYAIEVLNSNKLTCRYSTSIKQNKAENIVVETPCYNASELGGDIPSYLTDDGEYVSVDSVYRVLLKPDKPIQITNVQRGTVILKTDSPSSIAARFFYKLKTLWVEESGF